MLIGALLISRNISYLGAVMAKQLFFSFPVLPAWGKEDFFIAPSNQQAASLINEWPNWSDAVQLLVAPACAGKTHLAQLWQEKTGANSIEARELRGEIAELLQKRALVIEGIDELSGEQEEKLFHLINAAREENCFLLLTSSKQMGHCSFQLPDLASRLKAVPVTRIEAPEDELLGALLLKLCQDRQWKLSPRLLSYLLPRMERSMGAVAELIEKIDYAIGTEKKELTMALLRKLLTEE